MNLDTELALTGQIPRLARNVVVQITPRNLGLEVAAQVYGFSADEIARRQDAGEMPVVRIGRRRLVPVKQMDAWLDAQVRGGIIPEGGAA